MKIENRELVSSGRLLRIGSLDGEGYFFLAQPERVLQAVRHANANIDLFTFTQCLSETKPLFNYPYEIFNFAALTITSFDEWWNRQIGFKARNKAKQAQKNGVTIRETPMSDALMRGIWEIYNETPVRQGRRFLHYGKSLECVRRLSTTYPEKSIFIGAYYSDRLIGFVKLLFDAAHACAGMVHILSLIAHRDKSPTNALVAAAIRACAERKLAYLTYSSFAYGNKLNSSLSEFKQRNGFARVDVPRYFVPLTRWGSFAWKHGFHRGLKERLPENVASQLRNLRSAWYQRRFGSCNDSL